MPTDPTELAANPNSTAIPGITLNKITYSNSIASEAEAEAQAANAANLAWKRFDNPFARDQFMEKFANSVMKRFYKMGENWKAWAFSTAGTAYLLHLIGTKDGKPLSLPDAFEAIESNPNAAAEVYFAWGLWIRPAAVTPKNG
jgi:hypothetical protein